MTEEHPCATQVYHSQGAGHYYTPCSRKGKVERDGKWWCKQHDPEEVKRRRATSSAIFQEQYEAKQAVWHRKDVIMDACKDFETKWLEQGGLPRLVEVLQAYIATYPIPEAEPPEAGGWTAIFRQALP